MVDTEENFSKNFYIAPRHEKFLNGINENHSLALRTVLDSLIKGEYHKSRREFLNDLLTRISLGFLLILMSYLMTDPLIFIITFCLGLFILIYSTIGGIVYRLQISKTKGK